MFILAAIIHEFGHAIAAKRVGYEFLTTIIGPFRLYRDRDGLHLGLTGESDFWRGATICLPNDDEDLRDRHLIFMMGGPVATFLTGALCFGVPFLMLLAGQWPANDYLLGLFAFVMLFGFYSLIYLIAVLVIRKKPGTDTDGKQIFLLKNQSPEAKRYFAILKLEASRFSGVRPQDFDPEMLGHLFAFTDDTANDGIAHDFAYEHYLDTREYAKARDHLQNGLEILRKDERWLRPLAIIKAVEFEIHIRKDVENAKLLYSKLSQKKALAPRSPFYFARAEAALLAAEGKVREARHRIEVAKIHLSKSIALQATETDREWLFQLEKEIRAMLQK